MSFTGYKDVISEGDTVILYLTISHLYSVQATRTALSKRGVNVENVCQTTYGALKCADLIGKRYGSKVELSNGWAYVMQPTPELWSLTLPHRTQIIYSPDASMIILQLELEPGSTVVESGTGSGSLSHTILRAIQPNGHLYTFDFHEERTKTAQDEFRSHGLSDFVTVQQRDVCKNGFGDDLNTKIDAIILDLPEPWLAIEAASKLFKSSGGRLCSFSPCIEQVQKTCTILSELDFEQLQTMEIIHTKYTVQSKSYKFVNLDYLKHPKDGTETKGEHANDVVESTVATPVVPSRNHTGYLTFATYPPHFP